jgi:hypothetical protein
MLQHSLLLLGLPVGLSCDSLGVLPSATVPGIGGMYGKNADRNRHEAQPVAAVARATWPEGRTSHGPYLVIQTALSIFCMANHACSIL